MHPLTIEAGDSAYLSAAQLGGAFSDKIKHRLRIGRRHRNDAKNFVGCGLGTSIIIQSSKMPGILGSERHALIPRPFHSAAQLSSVFRIVSHPYGPIAQKRTPN